MELRSIIALLSLIPGFAASVNACVLLGVPASHSQEAYFFEKYWADHQNLLVKVSSVVDTEPASADILTEFSNLLNSPNTVEEQTGETVDLEASLIVKPSSSTENDDVVVELNPEVVLPKWPSISDL